LRERPHELKIKKGRRREKVSTKERPTADDDSVDPAFKTLQIGRARENIREKG